MFFEIHVRVLERPLLFITRTFSNILHWEVANAENFRQEPKIKSAFSNTTFF